MCVHMCVCVCVCVCVCNSCTPFRHGIWKRDTYNVDHKGRARGVYASVCFPCTVPCLNGVQRTCIPWQQTVPVYRGNVLTGDTFEVNRKHPPIRIQVYSYVSVCLSVYVSDMHVCVHSTVSFSCTYVVCLCSTVYVDCL